MDSIIFEKVYKPNTQVTAVDLPFNTAPFDLTIESIEPVKTYSSSIYSIKFKGFDIRFALKEEDIRNKLLVKKVSKES